MPGKNVTIRELAQAANVSIGTVSRALKNQPGLSAQTRAEVLRVALELGYDVGKLRTGKPRRILFLYNRALDSLATNQFYSVVLHGAETACREAGVLLGLLRTTSTELVVQTLYGAATMLRETHEHPTVLREQVSSPGGTTVAALRQLDDHKVRAAFLTAMEAARDRSRELADQG